MFAFRIVIAIMLLSASIVAGANGVAQTNIEAIREQQQKIRAVLEDRKGAYKDMSEADRSKLFAEQSKVEQLTQGKTSTSDLDERSRVELFNSLETIKAIVTNAEDERMVCERVKRTGSNRPERVCKTVAQRRAESEDASRDMDLKRRSLGCSEATMGPGGCAN